MLLSWPSGRNLWRGRAFKEKMGSGRAHAPISDNCFSDVLVHERRMGSPKRRRNRRADLHYRPCGRRGGTRPEVGNERSAGNGMLVHGPEETYAGLVKAIGSTGALPENRALL